ncbi:MAG: RNA-binding cell elongation regulator Jag/EloR, partial [Gemmiger qucibialis]
MREYVATAKTVEEAIQLGCEALSVDRDDLGVSYEILEMPQKTGFLGLKVTPAKVKVTVETADTEPETTPAAPAEAETPLDIAADPRLQAAVDYLTPIFHLMGVEEFTFTAGKKGEATILHVEGAHLGALIGRRGETMESLSYLASLVVNRMEGPYVKLGIDVGGYRNKREDDLTALAVRIANRVIRTGCYYEMEPMNPYERHIIHTAVAEIEGVRSESKGEGPDRRVVIYST